jgi:Ca2+-binding RTX toxin-like protein
MTTFAAGRGKLLRLEERHMRVYVYVSTKKGYDTRYFFPGEINGPVHGPGVNPAFPISTNGQYLGVGHFSYYLASYHWAPQAVDGDHFTGRMWGWYVQDERLTEWMQGRVAITDDKEEPVEIESSLLNEMTPTFAAIEALNEGVRRGRDAHTIDIFLYGNKGNDTLRGSSWDDDLDGRKGADRMIGNLGDDNYWVDHKGDRVIEEVGEYTGEDQVLTRIDYTLGNNVENLDGLGSRGLKLTGNSLANTIWGSDGRDTIKGMGGDDVIAAYAGGSDQIHGGGGDDRFVYLSPAASGEADRIVDFRPADDTIMLLRTGFPSIAAYNFTGPLPDVFFAANKNGKAKDANDFIVYDSNDGKLYYDPDGSGAAQRQLIVNLAGDPRLTAADILIV